MQVSLSPQAYTYHNVDARSNAREHVALLEVI